MSEKCLCCRWWLHSAGNIGQCRRRAPEPVNAVSLAFVAGADALRCRWPLTQANEWCGDHEWKPPEPAPISTAEASGRTELAVVPPETPHGLTP